MKSTVLVTGGSSGIGLETALALKARGCTVYEMSRREKGADGIIHIQGDVTSGADISRAVSTVLEREGGIDIVINAAGFGISGAVEFTEAADAKRQFDVNFFGMVNVNRAVLPIMRERRRGRIVNISSVAAPIAIPFQTYYSASKAAINSYTLCLANEVRPFGITVCAVQPGDIATGFTAARKKSDVGDREYNGRISRSVAVMEHDEENGMTAKQAGSCISKIALSKRKKPLFTIGGKYKLFVLLAKLLPASAVNRIVGLIYAH